MSYQKELGSPVRRAREQLQKDQARDGKEEPQEWFAYRSSVLEYDKSFRDVLPEKTLAKHIEARKASGRSNLVLDLASDGHAFLELDHDGALAVGLSDQKTDEEMELYNEQRVETVVGNILERKTWNCVDAWLAKHSSRSFDLVFFRPLGGIAYIGQEPSETESGSIRVNEYVLIALLKRLYPRLADHGELFAVVEDKHVVSETLLQRWQAWTDALNKIPGLKARLIVEEKVYDQIIFWMQKDDEAPKEMPEVLLDREDQ